MRDRRAASKVDRFLEICEKWDVIATVIGEVTDGDRAGDLLARRADRRRRPAHGRPRGPGLRAPVRPPRLAGRAPGRRRRTSCPARQTGEELRDQVLKLVASPNQASKSWITDQYDRFVQGNTVLAQPEDSGMIRIDEESEPRRRHRHRRQRPLRQARPVHGRAARAGRGVPQRRRRPAPSRSPSPTA